MKHFAIAGPDRQFVWAKARIKGNKVEVWSDKVPRPVAVRYAWADYPEGLTSTIRRNCPPRLSGQATGEPSCTMGVA